MNTELVTMGDDRKDGDDNKLLDDGEGFACVHGTRLLVKEYTTVFHICQPLARRPGIPVLDIPPPACGIIPVKPYLVSGSTFLS
jgi:hypothetical protein